MRINRHSTPWINPQADERLCALFLEHGTPETVAKGTCLSNEDSLEQELFFVRQGLLTMSRNHLHGNKTQFMTLVPPNRFTNHASLMMGRPVMQTIHSHHRSLIYRISYKKFSGILAQDAQLSLLFYQHCTHIIESTTDGLMATLMLPPDIRLLLFLWVQDPDKGKSEWVRQSVRLKIEDLAKIAYLTDTTIKRIRSRWKEVGLLKKEDGQIYYHQSLFDKLQTAVEWV